MVKSVLLLLLLSIVATQALIKYDVDPESLPDGVYTDAYYVEEEVGSGDYEGYENYYEGDYEKGNNYYDGPVNSDDEDNYGSGELGSGDEEDYEDVEVVTEADESEKSTVADSTTEEVQTTSTPAMETKSSTSIIPNEEEGEIDVPTTVAPKAPQTPKRKHPHHKKNKEAPEKKEEEEVKIDIDVVEQQGSSFNLSDGHFLTAAIIGGCIGFLFAVALIMLLLYRMRKKDEGSFSLQDGKKKGGPPGYQYKQGTEYYA